MNKDKIFSIVMFALIGIGVLGVIPRLSLWGGQEILALSVALAFLSLYFIRNVYIKLFALWHIVRFVMLINEVSLMTLFTTMSFLFFYEALLRSINEQRIKSLLNAVCVVCILEALFIVLQSRGVWIAIIPKTFNAKEWATFFPDKLLSVNFYLKNPSDLFRWLCGTTGNINVASALMGLSFPAFLRRGWLFFTPLIIYVLWLTHSLNGIIPAFVVTLIFIIVKFKKARWWLPLLPVSLFLFYFFKKESLDNILHSGSYRYDAWGIVMSKLIPVRWLEGWGVGQGAYLDKIIKLYWKHPENVRKWVHCHSEPLNLWIELGIIGLLIALAYFAVLFWKSRKIIHSNKTAFLAFLGVIGGLVNSLFSFSLHLNIGIVFFLFMTILDYYGNQKTEGLR